MAGPLRRAANSSQLPSQRPPEFRLFLSRDSANARARARGQLTATGRNYVVSEISPVPSGLGRARAARRRGETETPNPAAGLDCAGSGHATVLRS